VREEWNEGKTSSSHSASLTYRSAKDLY
jgi:hypothetical protein